MEIEVPWSGAAPARAGALYQDAGGSVFFQYDPHWRAGRRDLSPVYLLASGFRAARINGRASGITRPDLLQLAAAHDLQQAKPIIEQVVHSISQWPAHAAANGISPTHSAWITSQLQLDF